MRNSSTVVGDPTRGRKKQLTNIFGVGWLDLLQEIFTWLTSHDWPGSPPSPEVHLLPLLPR